MHNIKVAAALGNLASVYLSHGQREHAGLNFSTMKQSGQEAKTFSSQPVCECWARQPQSPTTSSSPLGEQPPLPHVPLSKASWQASSCLSHHLLFLILLLLILFLSSSPCPPPLLPFLFLFWQCWDYTQGLMLISPFFLTKDLRLYSAATCPTPEDESW
jgi:hypothetical protein